MRIITFHTYSLQLVARLAGIEPASRGSNSLTLSIVLQARWQTHQDSNLNLKGQSLLSLPIGRWVYLIITTLYVASGIRLSINLLLHIPQTVVSSFENMGPKLHFGQKH